MSQSGSATVSLTEFQPVAIAANELPEAGGKALWEEYRQYLEIAPPSFATGNQWRLTSMGTVGYLPISDELALRIRPRVPAARIFAMWDIAHQVKLEWRSGEQTVESVEELYSQIAGRLAALVLKRIHAGLYQRYVDREDELPYVRGRMNVALAVQRPWQVRLACEFDEQTASITDNQILLAALRTALEVPIGTPETRARLGHAYRELDRLIEPADIPASSCLNRPYDRLNAEYEPMHWLAHFLLSNAGPTHMAGTHPLRPFIIRMPALFERFVAEWLIASAPPEIRIDRQVSLPLIEGLRFQPDVVIRDAGTKSPKVVLDTKYKLDSMPSEEDIQQVVAYATHLGCVEAVLVYPFALHSPVSMQVGQVRVRTLAFDLSGDHHMAGDALLKHLGVAR